MTIGVEPAMGKQNSWGWNSRNPCLHVALGVVRRYADGKCAQCRLQRTRTWEENNRETRRGYAAKYRATSPNCAALKRKAALKSRGVVFAPGQTAESLLKAQNYICPICGASLVSPICKIAVDHDHAMEYGPNVRGIVHQKCNVALGLLGDSPKIMSAAFEYLISPPGLREKRP